MRLLNANDASNSPNKANNNASAYTTMPRMFYQREPGLAHRPDLEGRRSQSYDKNSWLPESNSSQGSWKFPIDFERSVGLSVPGKKMSLLFVVSHYVQKVCRWLAMMMWFTVDLRNG